MDSNNQESKYVDGEGHPYPIPLDDIRRNEYPALQATTYLDHAGTTPPPQSAINTYAKDMNTHLFGNPHSASPSSMLSTERIELVRRQLLAFFQADPAHFDLVFVANATAAVKLVIECVGDFSLKQTKRGNGGGFWYGYHRDCHTSLVGPREVARFSKYFDGDLDVEQWLSSPQMDSDANVGIFAYPAQSNMNGRRLPMEWPGRLRKSSQSADLKVYSLLDAAAFVSTAQLDLSDPECAPDFTSLSFYKIFGFPDLGALIVRKEAGHIFTWRRYLGGGTVDMVVNDRDPVKTWHARKQSALHEMLEDGTPPFTSVIALGSALQIHTRLYGSMKNISKHTNNLINVLYRDMAAITYANGQAVCEFYTDPSSTRSEDSKRQGPTIAFNVKASNSRWIGKSQLEQAAIAANIQLRTGGVCNPGGVAAALGLTAAEMKQNFAEGVRCGNDVDEMHGKPTGVARVSLGAMTNLEDVNKFVSFLTVFAETHGAQSIPQASSRRGSTLSATHSPLNAAKGDMKVPTPMQPVSTSPPSNDNTQGGRLPKRKQSGNKDPLWQRILRTGWKTKHGPDPSNQHSALKPTHLCEVESTDAYVGLVQTPRLQTRCKASLVEL